MASYVKVKLHMPSAQQVIKVLGMDENGNAQKAYTEMVLNRIINYMPYKTGEMIMNTIENTDYSSTKTTTTSPQTRFLYFGVPMVGIESRSAWAKLGEKKETVEGKLNYTKTHNPNAGSYWDKRMIAAEGDALKQEFQEYWDKLKKQG